MKTNFKIEKLTRSHKHRENKTKNKIRRKSNNIKTKKRRENHIAPNLKSQNSKTYPEPQSQTYSPKIFYGIFKKLQVEKEKWQKRKWEKEKTQYWTEGSNNLWKELGSRTL